VAWPRLDRLHHLVRRGWRCGNYLFSCVARCRCYRGAWNCRWSERPNVTACAIALAAWRCSPRLPVSLLGLVVVMRAFLCTIGSAFRHPIPFRNPRRLVKRFVSAPFLFAGR
jgi:hypothetical protein